jgi:hypothetical protein
MARQGGRPNTFVQSIRVPGVNARYMNTSGPSGVSAHRVMRRVTGLSGSDDPFCPRSTVQLQAEAARGDQFCRDNADNQWAPIVFGEYEPWSPVVTQLIAAMETVGEGNIAAAENIRCNFLANQYEGCLSPRFKREARITAGVLRVLIDSYLTYVGSDRMPGSQEARDWDVFEGALAAMQARIMAMQRLRDGRQNYTAAEQSVIDSAVRTVTDIARREEVRAKHQENLQSLYNGLSDFYDKAGQMTRFGLDELKELVEKGAWIGYAVVAVAALAIVSRIIK